MQTDKTGNGNYFYDLMEKDKVAKNNSDLKNEFKSLLNKMSFKSDGMDITSILKSNSKVNTDFTKVDVYQSKASDYEKKGDNKSSLSVDNNDINQVDDKKYQKSVELKKVNKPRENNKEVNLNQEEKDSYDVPLVETEVEEKAINKTENIAFDDEVGFLPSENQKNKKDEQLEINPLNQMVENKEIPLVKIADDSQEIEALSENKEFEVSSKDTSKTKLDFISNEVVKEEVSDYDGENFTHFINSLVKKETINPENNINNLNKEDLTSVETLSNDNFDLINFEEVKKETKKQPLENDFSKVKEQMNKISSVVGGNEAVVIDVAKEAKKQEKVGLNSFNSVPLMTANDDGEFEMVLNQAQMSNNANENNFNSDLISSFDENNSKNVEMADGEVNFSFNMSAPITTGETKGLGSVTNSGVRVDNSLKIDGIHNMNAQTKNVDMKNMKTEVKEINGKLEVKASEIANQIKVKVQNLKQGEDKITIKLKPYELGDIEIKLNISKDGKVSAVINSNKQETMQIMQKDVEALQKMFNDNGYKADVSSFSFNFKGSNSQGQDGNNHQNNENYARSNLSKDDANMKQESLPSYQGRGILA